MLGWLGLAWLGAIEVPINNHYRGALLAHALNLTRASVMLVRAQFLDRVIEVADGLKHLRRVIVIDGEPAGDAPFELVSGEAFLKDLRPALDLEVPRPWDIMAVLFTSGTTGPSKAVRIPWAQIHAMSTGTFPLEDLDSDDVIYNPGPTYHVGAKVFPYLAALVGGRHLVRPFVSRTAMAGEYLKFGVTSGTIVYDWLDEPPCADDQNRPLRNLLAVYSDPAVEPFAVRFGCRRFGCFNMTEVSCPITFSDWDRVIHDEAGRLSCGVIRPGYEARIVDAFDQPLLPGEPGELVIRAEIPWVLNAGYLNNPEATAEAWRNGWFHTGDLVQQDHSGSFYFIDRLKDSIRRRGENISSFEIEAYVNDHPSVAQSAAVAVKLSEHPGAEEEIRIVVERRPGERLEAEALIRWLIPRAPRFMIPRYVDFIDALPRTPTQKIRKTVLRDTGVGPSTWDREKAGIVLPR
jgi:crotonobetaine/carnitine-CoA ligase